MIVRNKEALYMLQGDKTYVVKPGTNGVERNRIVYFYDTTRSVAVGFDRDLCVENPMFSVNRVIEDREVALRDVYKVIENQPLTPDQKRQLLDEVNSL